MLFSDFFYFFLSFFWTSSSFSYFYYVHSFFLVFTKNILQEKLLFLFFSLAINFINFKFKHFNENGKLQWNFFFLSLHSHISISYSLREKFSIFLEKIWIFFKWKFSDLPLWISHKFQLKFELGFVKFQFFQIFQ